MATPSTPGLHWATAARGRPRHPASDAPSVALGEHLHHCRTRPGRRTATPRVSSPSLSAQRSRLAALLAHAARLIR